MMVIIIAVLVVMFISRQGGGNRGAGNPDANTPKNPPAGGYYDDPAPEEKASRESGAKPSIDRSDWSMESVDTEPKKESSKDVEIRLNQPNPQSGKKASGDWEIDTKAGDTPSGGK